MRWPEPIERFMGCVSPCPVTGCWWWLGADDGDGRYGRTYVNGRKMGAHRAAWLLFRDAIPNGLRVLHRCDQPACVNPAHLFLGTQRDNVADMFSKRRDNHARGAAVNTAKLTAGDVADIRTMLRMTNFTHKMIAGMYGVQKAAIGKIARGATWAHDVAPFAKGNEAHSGS